MKEQFITNFFSSRMGCATNTPPIRTKMRSVLLLFALLLSIGQVWGAEDVVYTLTPAEGSNNSYTGNCDVIISDITWNVTGNSKMLPWRIGGQSLSNVDRTVYSKTAMGSAITKVELVVGAASGITVNSLKLIVASDADFSNKIDEVSKTFSANSTIPFTPTSPATEWATGAYYKFVFNVTVTGSSNKYVQFSEAKFYAEASGSDLPAVFSVTKCFAHINISKIDVYSGMSQASEGIVGGCGGNAAGCRTVLLS